MSQQRNPFIGIWELDPARSEYQFGPPPLSATYIIEPIDERLKFTIDGVLGNGAPIKIIYEGTPDGVDYPYSDSPTVDCLMLHYDGERSLETVSKKEGRIVARGLRSLSADGREMTITQSGTAPDGKTFDNISVYVKKES